MFRSYRCIILGVAGLVLVGAAKAPQPTGKAEQQQAQAKSADAALDAKAMPAQASEQVQAPKDSQPCGNSRYRSDDDLCAQWKAADAARDAANWAWWQLGLSALGVLGLGMTLWFNFRALKLAEGASQETKDALAIAERNAEAASQQVAVAKDTAQRQLRAYVCIEDLSYGEIIVGKVVSIPFDLINKGQTPAHNVCFAGSAFVRHRDWVFEDPGFSGEGERTQLVIPPSGKVRVFCTTDVILPQAVWDNVMSGASIVYCIGVVLYDDSFGNPCKTTIRARYDHSEESGVMAFCAEGNTMT